MKIKLQVIIIVAVMIATTFGSVLSNNHHKSNINTSPPSHKNVKVVIEGETMSFSINVKYGYYDANDNYQIANFYMPASYGGTYHWFNMAQDHLSDIAVRVLARNYRNINYLNGFNNTKFNTLDWTPPKDNKGNAYPIGIFVWGTTAATPHVNIWEGMKTVILGDKVSAGAEIGWWY